MADNTNAYYSPVSSPASDDESGGGAAAAGGGGGGGSAYSHHNHNRRNGSSIREQDRLLPIANVGRIMKKALPNNAKISKDAKETVQECVSEFISFITGEASDKCQREKRKTINGDDLLWAMGTLGFENYVDPLKLYLQKYRELEGEKTSMARQGGDQSPTAKEPSSAAPPGTTTAGNGGSNVPGAPATSKFTGAAFYPQQMYGMYGAPPPPPPQQLAQQMLGHHVNSSKTATGSGVEHHQGRGGQW